MKKYTKKDFLEYASAFDYSEDAKNNNLGGYKSDEEIKEDMKSWSLEKFHDFYDFTHYDWESGKQIRPYYLYKKRLKQQANQQKGTNEHNTIRKRNN